MRHLWAKWYVKAAVVVVAAVLGAFVSGSVAHELARLRFGYGYRYYVFGRRIEIETAVLLFTLAGGGGFIIALVVVLFRYFGFRRFSNRLRLAQLKLLWRRRTRVVLVVLAVVVVALLFVALKPTYSSDEVTKKISTYLDNRVHSQSSSLSVGFGEPRINTATTSCYQLLGAKELATPHYIPYRKAWRVTSVSSLVVGRDVVTGAVTREKITWLFDERTGTIASSDSRC